MCSPCPFHFTRRLSIGSARLWASIWPHTNVMTHVIVRTYVRRCFARWEVLMSILLCSVAARSCRPCRPCSNTHVFGSRSDTHAQDRLLAWNQGLSRHHSCPHPRCGERHHRSWGQGRAFVQRQRRQDPCRQARRCQCKEQTVVRAEPVDADVRPQHRVHQYPKTEFTFALL